jgi:hypothetical protein
VVGLGEEMSGVAAGRWWLVGPWQWQRQLNEQRAERGGAAGLLSGARCYGAISNLLLIPSNPNPSSRLS